MIIIVFVLEKFGMMIIIIFVLEKFGMMIIIWYSIIIVLLLCYTLLRFNSSVLFDYHWS